MVMKILRLIAPALLVAGVAALSACSPVNDTKTMVKIFIPDTQSMNADRFGDETFPVFMRPAPTPMALQPRGISTRLRSDGFPPPPAGNASELNPPLQQDTLRYGPVSDGRRMLPAIPVAQVDARLLRHEISYRTNERPGTLIVDTRSRYLYLVLNGGRALRYGVGIGREGYAWSGRGEIRYKEEWPHWTPTGKMVKNDPDLRSISAKRGGLVAGLNNPLGARALYIYRDGRDTLYRVHGTPDWRSIGKKTSSGCVRMFNQDVIDLYNRVDDGAAIVVL
jgi:lipoprotein-anchoring transpeptidase ErfK/SrfK